MTVCLTIPKVLAVVGTAAAFVGRHAAAVVVQRTVASAIDRRFPLIR